MHAADALGTVPRGGDHSHVADNRRDRPREPNDMLPSLCPEGQELREGVVRLAGDGVIARAVDELGRARAADQGADALRSSGPRRACTSPIAARSRLPDGKKPGEGLG